MSRGPGGQCAQAVRVGGAVVRGDAPAMDGRRSPGGQPTKANADLPTSLAPSGATPTSPGASSSSISIALKASSSTAVSPATAASPMGVGGAVVSPVVSSKILGRNSNGTVVMTSVPANEAELQLYRVMQRASLLAYYDTLLEMGGDDVQQLCEAGEEEFLEIMALVGMASKPLHVRRLQKALQEWFNNPAQFQVPLGPSPAFPVAIPAPRPLVGPGVAATPQATPLAVPSAARSPPLSHTSPGPAALSPAPSLVPERPERPERQEHLSRSTASSPVAVRPALTPPSPADPMQTAMGSIPVPMDFSTASTTTTTTTAGNNHHLNHNHHSHHSHSHYNNNHHHHLHHQPTSPSTSPLQTGPGRPLSAPLSSPTPSSTPMTPRSLSPSLQLTPVLLESQIQRLAEAARNLSRTLPSCQPRPHNTKKKICKDLELVINMSDEDPRRMDEIRKYAAIYGRFDCKRKPEKPLTLHEVSVNEAAAQICRFVPALLTRRDELFPLARQVVRDSGYLYSKGHTNLSCYRPRCPSGDDILTAGHKRARLEPGGSPSPDSSEGDRVERAERAEQLQRRQERLEAVSEELRALPERLEDLLAATGAAHPLDVPALHAVRDALQARQAALQAEHAELLRQTLQPRSYRRSARLRSSSLTMDSERGDTDEESQLSFSNASSPSQEVGDSRDSDVAERTSRSSPLKNQQDSPTVPTGNGVASYGDGFFNESKVQVIASRGSDIIAVANPALSMSSALSPTGTPGGGPSSPVGVRDSSNRCSTPRNDLLKLEPQSPPPSPEKVL